MTDHERAASPARETALSRSPQARPSTGRGEPEANDSRAASFTPPLAGRAAPSRAVAEQQRAPMFLDGPTLGTNGRPLLPVRSSSLPLERTSGSERCPADHQDALRIPGILPSCASSRITMRQTPKRR